MDEFEKQIKEMVKIRNAEEARANEEAKRNGEYEYTKFCCWCNAFRTMADQTNPKAFADFLKEENIELTFWQKKAIAEKYFGYEYTLNYETNEWEIKKKKGECNG